MEQKLKETCSVCCYLGRIDELNIWYCNCGSSNHYQQDVTAEDVYDCEDFEY